MYEQETLKTNETLVNSSGILLINGLPHIALDLSKLAGLEDSVLLSHLCPSQKCIGDNFCCGVCQDYHSPIWHLVELELEDILVVKNQPVVLLSCVTVTTLLLIMTWVLSYIQLQRSSSRQHLKQCAEEDNDDTTIDRTTTT